MPGGRSNPSRGRGMKIVEGVGGGGAKHYAKQTEYIDKNGMHVVVGRYMGANSLTHPSNNPNLTYDEINANNYLVG